MDWSEECEEFGEELGEELESEIQFIMDKVPVGSTHNIDLSKLAAVYAAHSPFKQSFVLKELKSLIRHQINQGTGYHDPVEFSLKGNTLSIYHPHTGMYRGEEYEIEYSGAPRGSLPIQHMRSEFLKLEDVPYDMRERFNDPAKRWRLL